MLKEDIDITKNEKISLANRLRWSNPENKKKLSEKMKLYWNNPEFRSLVSKKISEAKKGKSHKPHTEETKRKMSLNNCRYWKNKKHSREWKKKVSEVMKIYRQNPSIKIKTSELSKLLWKNLEYREKVIKNSLNSLFKRPTSLELKWMRIFRRHNLPYKYTGDGSFLIGYKNPDFINIDGKKICIEVRNPEVTLYLQKKTLEQYETERINHYSKYGWNCIVIWGK